VRFEILPWLYGPEKFPRLSRNGPLVSYLLPYHACPAGHLQSARPFRDVLHPFWSLADAVAAPMTAIPYLLFFIWSRWLNCDNGKINSH